MEERIKELEARIAELEKKHEGTPRMTAANLSPEDIQAFHKVRDVIAADWGDFCGVNDCFRCIPVARCGGPVLRCIARCINECVCGPCSAGPFGAGGGGNFGGFGS
jgi:hypothetical protein